MKLSAVLVGLLGNILTPLTLKEFLNEVENAKAFECTVDEKGTLLKDYMLTKNVIIKGNPNMRAIVERFYEQYEKTKVKGEDVPSKQPDTLVNLTKDDPNVYVEVGTDGVTTKDVYKVIDEMKKTKLHTSLNISAQMINVKNVKGHLVHCIAMDNRQSAGFAKQVRENYGDKVDLLQGRLAHGSAAVLKVNDQLSIINLVTKYKSDEKPRMTDFYRALINMAEYIIDKEIDVVTSPFIGTGLDGLDPVEVIAVINYVTIKIRESNKHFIWNLHLDKDGLKKLIKIEGEAMYVINSDGKIIKDNLDYATNYLLYVNPKCIDCMMEYLYENKIENFEINKQYTKPIDVTSDAEIVKGICNSCVLTSMDKETMVGLYLGGWDHQAENGTQIYGMPEVKTQDMLTIIQEFQKDKLNKNTYVGFILIENSMMDNFSQFEKQKKVLERMGVNVQLIEPKEEVNDEDIANYLASKIDEEEEVEQPVSDYEQQEDEDDDVFKMDEPIDEQDSHQDEVREDKPSIKPVSKMIMKREVKNTDPEDIRWIQCGSGREWLDYKEMNKDSMNQYDFFLMTTIEVNAIFAGSTAIKQNYTDLILKFDKTLPDQGNIQANAVQHTYMWEKTKSTTRAFSYLKKLVWLYSRTIKHGLSTHQNYDHTQNPVIGYSLEQELMIVRFEKL